MTRRHLLVSAAIFAVAGSVSGLFFIQFCGTLYQCGCQPLWSGAAAHCNIHQPAARHCPLCSIGTAGASLFLGAMLAVQAVLSLFPRQWDWPARLAASLAGFPLSGGILGLVLGLWTGYWD